jgi:ketosteroid isomerase-like protein
VRHEIVEPEPTTTNTTTTTTTTLPPEPDFSKKDMLAIYNTLVDNIKKRNVDAIMSCYAEDGSYYFSDMTRADFVCYNGTKRVNGADEIRANWTDRFRRIKKDRIEYEVQQVNTDPSDPYIIFVNAWDNADFSHYEMITFKKLDDGSLAIAEHKVVKSKEVRPLLHKDDKKK